MTAILVILVITSPILLLGAVVFFDDLTSRKRHNKWIMDFKERHR